MDNSITIDKGERKTEKGKVVIKWHFTLVEEGDYEWLRLLETIRDSKIPQFKLF